ncbi:MULTISPECIES: EpsG family protein [unclassified Pseudoalteromonas]|uniref:EpsG family protein n=1 Tax=unclassified Pseudoalteromonas TaxID=194690 RepID=UPI0013FDA7C0|nr:MULTISPECIES: EpsG family protein [unclassified Pseudoalteromonas]MBH0048910.1 EpsG family protein [Pseudoalteromonas sp. SWYJZ19]
MYAYIFFPIIVSIIFFLYDNYLVRLKSIEFKAVSFILLCLTSFFLSSLYGWRVIEDGYGGIDADTYKSVFDGLSYSYFDALEQQRYEKGYATVVWFFRTVIDNYQIFQFFYFLVMLFLYRLITKSITSSIFGLFSYFLIAFFLIISFNLSRMMLGVFILFFVVKFLSKNEYKKAVLITLLSSLIQMVCLWGVVFIIYYYVLNKVKSKTLFIFLFLLVLANSFLIVEVFKVVLISVNYGHYLSKESEGFSGANYLYAIYLSIIYYLFLNKSVVSNPVSDTIFKLLPTMVFIIPLYFAIPIAYRFNFIYILFFAFIVPDLFIFLKKNNTSFILRIIIAVVPVLYITSKVYNFYTRDVLSAENWSLLPAFYIF